MLSDMTNAARPEPPVEGVCERCGDTGELMWAPGHGTPCPDCQPPQPEAVTTVSSTPAEPFKSGEPPVEGALEEAQAAAVAFGEANPDSDELDLASYAQGYRDARAAARSGHDGLREALADAASAYHAAEDHDWFGPTLSLADCIDQRCTLFRRALSPDPEA